ncbi:hypothetical protein GS421_06635 [Rhodococcus hoagii]|nr:hypothetical protein [Prescottella equi]
MTSTKAGFIPLYEQDALAALLRDEVPDILAALAACITAEGHRTRISYDPKVTNGSDEQPLPYDNSAQDAADHLGKRTRHLGPPHLRAPRHRLRRLLVPGGLGEMAGRQHHRARPHPGR